VYSELFGCVTATRWIFYTGCYSEYLGVIGLSQFSIFILYIYVFLIGGFHFAKHILYLPRLPNTMVGELGRYTLRVDQMRGRYYDRIGTIAKIQRLPNLDNFRKLAGTAFEDELDLLFQA
jgi:hypothetical protein